MRDKDLYIQTDNDYFNSGHTQKNFLKRSPHKKTPNLDERRQLYKKEVGEMIKRAREGCCV